MGPLSEPPEDTMLSTLIIVLYTAASPAVHDWNGLCLDKKGNVYVIDAEDGQIWRISKDGTVRVFLSGKKARQLHHPHHLAIDAKGSLWLASG